ncbi:MAG: hypothetical protein DCC75_01650 [Proteobacteria bacterium]|nr:MAG: hypothetical protein DCC75_01650 [Pseudomonadota bacterium]
MNQESEIARLQEQLKVNPNDSKILNALIFRLLREGRTSEAIPFIDRALDIDATDIATLWHASVAALHTGQLEKALKLLYELVRLKPDHHEARDKIRFLHGRLIEPWHFAMLNDHERNAVFEAAIKAAVKPGVVVVEVGTGSGLLSMMAARAGAEHVYTIEKSFALYNAAKQIIERNGLSNKITVLNCWSSGVQVGRDIPVKADLLIAEILGSAILDEQIVHFLNDARDRLLKPGGIVIPQRAVLVGALLESKSLRERFRVDTVSGFNLSLFNALYQQPSLQVDLSQFDFKLLSQPFEIFDFDFQKTLPSTRENRFSVKLEADGVCHGIARWIRLFADSSHVMESKPQYSRSHWQQTVEIFEEPVSLRSGSQVEVRAAQLPDRVFVRLSPPVK